MKPWGVILLLVTTIWDNLITGIVFHLGFIYGAPVFENNNDFAECIKIRK